MRFWRAYLLVAALLLSSAWLVSCGRQEESGTSVKGENSPKTVAQADTAPDDPMVKKGKVLFYQLGCNTCHMNPTTGKDYPDLRGLYGKTIRLSDDSTVKVDDEYLYESIKESNKRIVKGYTPAMPSFAHLKDDQVKALIAYIKSLKDEKPVFVKPESVVD